MAVLFNPNLREMFEEVRKREIISRFSSSINVYGEENLEKLRGKQFVAFSNHESHGDYFGYGYWLMDKGFECPLFTAGRNLNVWPIRWLLPFDKWEVVIWIDRKKIKHGSREEKEEEVRYLKNQVSRGLRQGKNIVDFVEGGRNYEGELKEAKHGVMRYILSEMNQEGMKGREIYGINSALDYDRRIEELAMPLIKKTSDNGKILRPLYYMADIGSFVAEFFKKKHPNLRIKFGEPFLLNEYSQMLNGIWMLKERVEKEIRELYEGIKFKRN